MNEIKIYPMKQSFGWIIGKQKWRIHNIQNDTNSIIKINDNYFSIIGNLINIHKARIIIQELEKEFYKNLMTTR